MALGAWCLMLLLHGAVPFLMMPTMGQAIWSLGFSQSFANQTLLSIYATNFGAPEPAAMAFGLPGAWLASLYIRLGLPPPDAYSAMVASWMTFAMWAAYAMARMLQVNSAQAIAAAFVWMSMPITWAHAGYSMLSIGIALLPSYFLCTLGLLNRCCPPEAKATGNPGIWVMGYPAACVLAVFMDGYSFMFFSAGASLMIGWSWLVAEPACRRRLNFVVLPLHGLSLATAYALYSVFVGPSGYGAPPIDVFRGWGADLSFFAIPSKGIHWLPDLLGWSTARSEQQHYGDSSVWVTTFCIPVLLAGLWAAWSVRAHRAVPALLLMIGFGFYMSLGPSIKLNSEKPAGAALEQVMPEEAALAPTGSAVLSEKLPGFKSMRASYRWVALGVFSAWALLLLNMTVNRPQKIRQITLALMVGVVVLNLPDMPTKTGKYAQNRNTFFDVERELVEPLHQTLQPGQRVAFLPYRNDFLANYIAARLNIVTFNIGGDKNLEVARTHWPRWMGSFSIDQIDDLFAKRVALLLAEKEADAVVLPYVDLLQAAIKWPPTHHFKNELQPIIVQLQQVSLFDITFDQHFALVRLKAANVNDSSAKLLGKVLSDECFVPSCKLSKNPNPNSLVRRSLLLDGWSTAEPWGRWSEGEQARVVMEIGNSSQEDIELLVEARAFLKEVAHEAQQVEVFFDDQRLGTLKYAASVDLAPSVRVLQIPRERMPETTGGATSWHVLTFRIKSPRSPADLGLSVDARKLGIGLVSLDLQEKAIATSQ